MDVFNGGGEIEEHEYGVGSGVNSIIMSDVLYGIGIANLCLLSIVIVRGTTGRYGIRSVISPVIHT